MKIGIKTYKKSTKIVLFYAFLAFYYCDKLYFLYL